jgi:hypothetical protein
MYFTLNKRNYYCLVAGLPDILIDGAKTGKGDLSLNFKAELSTHLHADDFDLAKLLYLSKDNENVQNLLFNQDKPFSVLGNYSETFLTEDINDSEIPVDYLVSLYRKFKREEFSLENINTIQASYYSHVLKTKNNFLKQWFTFEKDMKNVLTAINCRKYDYNLEDQLISVDNSNNVYNILAKYAPKVELLGDELAYADEIIQIAESEMDITAKEKAIDEIKWKFLDSCLEFNYFNVEIILAYILKLEMIERWAELDHEAGKALFSKMVHDLKGGYSFSEEFSLIKRKKVDKN